MEYKEVCSNKMNKKNNINRIKERSICIMFKKILLIIGIAMITLPLCAQKEAERFLTNQMYNKTRDIIYFKPITNLIHTNITTLDSVADTTVLGIYNREIVSSLKFFGFVVKEVSTFPNVLQDNEHTLTISQMEIEEYSFYDSITDDDMPKLKFYKELNGVKVNLWLTYNEQQESDKIIFYNEEQIADGMDGYFDMDSTNTPYVDYEIVAINPNDVYKITYINARNSAKYFFNFLLNRYVYIKTNGEDKNYYGISDYRTLITHNYPFANFDIVDE